MRTLPVFVDVTRPARSSTERCWVNDGNAIANGCASSDVDAEPVARRRIVVRQDPRFLSA